MVAFAFRIIHCIICGREYRGAMTKMQKICTDGRCDRELRRRKRRRYYLKLKRNPVKYRKLLDRNGQWIREYRDRKRLSTLST